MAEFKKKYGLSEVGAQGFCWGGKYTVLLLGKHPSKGRETPQSPCRVRSHISCKTVTATRGALLQAAAVLCEFSS